MRPFSKKKSLVAALLLTSLLVVVAEQIHAQNPTIKGKGKYVSTVVLTGTASLAGIAGEPVPDKMTFVLTDIMFSNTSASSEAMVQIFRQAPAPLGALLSNPIKIPAGQTFAHTFGTGLEFPATSKASLIVTGNAVTYTLVGYMRK